MSISKNVRPTATFYRWMMLLLIGILPFVWLFLQLGSTAIVRDWGYFYGKSILIHQSLDQFGVVATHDPFFIGGQDLIANPQSNILSPTILLDFIFPSPFSQLLRVIVLSILGSFGMYRLLLDKGISNIAALVGAFLFVHGSFFSLHIAEGHIPFAGFYLFGWFLYLLDKLGSFRHFVFFLFVNCFWILDGSIYCFLFGLLFMFFHFLVYRPFGEMNLLWQSIKIQRRQYFSALVLFSSWILLRIWSILSLLKDRRPEEEWIKPSFSNLLQGTLHPNQQIFSFNDKGEMYSFHEYGIYLGVVSVLCILCYILKHYSNREVKRTIAMLLIFVWIGTGIGGIVNPYTIIDRLPLFENAHVPSRYLFFVFFLSIILLAKALDWLFVVTRRMAVVGLISFLLIEYFLVSQVAFHKVYGYASSTIPTRDLKTIQLSDKIEQTLPYPTSKRFEIGRNSGFEFLGYHSANTAFKSSYEPALVQGKIQSINEAAYRSECYVLRGRGKAVLVSYLPGKIQLLLKNYGEDSMVISLNTNYLLGWTGEGVNCAGVDGLLHVTVPKNFNQRVELIYGSERRTLFFRLYWIASASLLILLLMFAYRNVRLFKNT